MSSETPDFPKADPRDEHRWLEQLTGTWTYESTAPECPSSGVVNIRMFGGIWMLAEAVGTAGGQPAVSLITLGFDPDKGRYVGRIHGDPLPPRLID